MTVNFANWIKRATSEVASLPLLSHFCVLLSRVRVLQHTVSFHAPAASNFHGVLLPTAVMFPHTPALSTLQNVNVRVETVRVALNMQTRVVQKEEPVSIKIPRKCRFSRFGTDKIVDVVVQRHSDRCRRRWFAGAPIDRGMYVTDCRCTQSQVFDKVGVPVVLQRQTPMIQLARETVEVPQDCVTRWRTSWWPSVDSEDFGGGHTAREEETTCQTA